ncbi:phage tape measure protein [Desulfatibacillum aliphaticivorans]|uniref:Phage tape measure protein n=1 Tax=Desulfatibacillum aliphaticivorans TaxID=218208 RepID=B8FC29_DESAL|nr:tape measure protein [Desulfatibacillum aliphaticivorans]ACL05234.1 phage tape measure protein [Desulfatibacillum aliphaticivorans]
MANEATLKIEIGVDDKGSPVVKGFGDNVEKSTKKTRRTLGFLKKDLSGIYKKLVNIRNIALIAFIGWGLAALSGQLIEVADSMEQLQMSLDTITQGQGQEWFDALNSWAMRMPVNTQKAIESFKMMRAMGLEPTLDQMTTLVDTMAAIGGGSDALEGISRALGQMQTKGKASAEEIMQLAERGVPAYQILAEKLGLTGDQLANLGNQGVTANQAIAALLEGMEERFGGMSEKLQYSWMGIMEGLKAYWKEFERLVMNSGAFLVLKETLGRIRDFIGEMHTDGRLAEWAAKTGAVIATTITKIVTIIGYIPAAWYSAKSAAEKFMAFLASSAKGLLTILQKAPLGVLTKLMDKAANWLGADNSIFSKPQKMIEGLSGAIDDFAMAQIEGAKESDKLAQKWMDVGVQVEGFSDNLQRQIDVAADQIAQSGDKAASAIGQAENALALSAQDTADKTVKAVLKTAEADLAAVNKRLSAYQSFYSQVTAMSERAKEQQAQHIQELMALEKARANASKQTGALVQGLAETAMDPMEKYESRRSALNQQFAEAMRLSGQEQVEALQAYQQAVSSLAMEFSQGVTQTTISWGRATEQTVISSKDVIADAVSDIERAGAVIDRTFRDMESAKARQIQADQAWVDSLASTAQEAATEIEYLSNLAASLAEQIKAMETEIEIRGKDEVSPVVALIQRELDSLHDKVVNITVKTTYESYGQASAPDPNSVMGSYASGTRFVPQTGPYILHKGEEVRTKSQAQAQGGNVTIGDITINVPQGAATQSPEDWRSITRNIIVPELQRLGK